MTDRIEIDLTLKIEGDVLRGRAVYCEGHGFDIDVFRNGKRIGIRNAACPTHGEGNRDVALVSDTIEAAHYGRKLGNLILTGGAE